jgi:hypothetical protein
MPKRIDFLPKRLQKSNDGLSNSLNRAIFNHPPPPAALSISLFQIRILSNGLSLSITVPLTNPPLKITIPYPRLRNFLTTYKGPPSSPR